MRDIKFMPEWKRQFATIVAMPHKNSDWKPYLAEVQASISEIIAQIARFQRVIVLYENERDIKKLRGQKNVILWRVRLNDSWCRDFAPLSVKKGGKIVLLDFIFNAWGAKYESALDNKAGAKIHKKLRKNFEWRYGRVKLAQKNFILEGGSIDTNGETLLTTAQCLLSKNRNNLSKARLTQKLQKYFGVKRVIWLENGFLEGDDTDSHIDNLARFVDKKTIVYLKCEDRNDAHFSALEAMEAELKKKCGDFKLVALPLPKAIFYDGARLPASYVNFIFANGAIFVPIFGDENGDKKAIEIFEKIAKGREVVPIDSRVLIRQGGGLHCSTMNLM